MRARMVVVVLAVAVTAGCGSDSPTAIASSLAGTWGVAQSVPGNAFSMTLATSGTAVSGSGTFAGEAGPQGTVAVSGSVSGRQVSLDIVFQPVLPTGLPSREELFVGQLLGNQLVGTIQDEPPAPGSVPQSAIFIRE